MAKKSRAISAPREFSRETRVASFSTESGMLFVLAENFRALAASDSFILLRYEKNLFSGLGKPRCSLNVVPS